MQVSISEVMGLISGNFSEFVELKYCEHQFVLHSGGVCAGHR